MAILKLILVCYSKQSGKQRVNLMLIIIEFHFENILYFFSWDEMTTEPCCICVIFVTVDCVSVYIIYIYLYVHVCGIVPGKIPFHLELIVYLTQSPPGQNGRHFADYIFRCIFVNENLWILVKISLKFVPNVQISNIPALDQIMAWRRPDDKPLSEPTMD